MVIGIGLPINASATQWNDNINSTQLPAPAAGLEHPEFIFAAEGFLYEWFPEADEASAIAISNLIKGADRKEMLKLFRQQEQLFLDAVYARWRGEIETNRTSVETDQVRVKIPR
ncbi:hypothetical protein ACG2F4_15085 [Halalkalibaculum sp. DA3122]|uniref:hypothetical protein n=1 Tax=Halalkalibaculum sp. DA3122 TaxID=3373607 RepID=UPI0037545ACA